VQNYFTRKQITTPEFYKQTVESSSRQPKTVDCVVSVSNGKGNIVTVCKKLFMNIFAVTCKTVEVIKLFYKIHEKECNL
jgi:hypothetical protein